MKKILALILALTLMLTACGGEGTVEQSASDTLRFYYIANNISELGTEESVRFEERDDSVFTLEQMLEVYFRGPEDPELDSPFPEGTGVLDISRENGETVLTLSDDYFTISGVELSLASCCLVNTISEYLGTDVVTVVDQMERIRLTLHPETYLLTHQLETETDTNFTIYFSDADGRYLLPEFRQVTLSENISEATYVMNQLIAGPDSDECIGIIPAGTELIGEHTADGICIINLSGAFVENRSGGSSSAYTTIFGIVNTLTSLEGINAVQFLVDGEKIESYDIFPLAEPVSRNLDIVGPVRTASGEVDIDMYVQSENRKSDFFVPLRVKPSTSQPLAEAVLDTIVDYDPALGFVNPIPYGTEVLSVSLSGSICYVDLSRHFVPVDNIPKNEKAAVFALVSALTELNNIEAVMLTVEGETDRLRFVEATEPLTVESIR